MGFAYCIISLMKNLLNNNNLITVHTNCVLTVFRFIKLVFYSFFYTQKAQPFKNLFFRFYLVGEMKTCYFLHTLLLFFVLVHECLYYLNCINDFFLFKTITFFSLLNDVDVCVWFFFTRFYYIIKKLPVVAADFVDSYFRF